MNERPTFSPFWHRVRLMKPRLRPHVDVTRQLYRGRRWHVAHDPTSNQFYRLNPIAYDFVAMLDGTRDVESAWKISLQKFGDAAPTQNEVIQLISQLYNSNLLSCDASPETEQLLRRGRERTKKKAVAQAIGIMYLKIRAFNPDRVITAIEPVLRPVLNRWGFIAWCALVLYALYGLLPYVDRLREDFNSQHLFDPRFVWLVPLAFVITKAIHELGHGVICKRFGGQVPEFGFMLLVLLPSPYVDASAAWSFADKWKRIAVGAGGMMFELVVASIAAIVYASLQKSGESGELASRLAFNIMLSSGISTVLFNANPLMRFDGYYILADLLETPNLQQRSQKMLQHLFQKYVYRLKNLTPPSTLPGERAILVTYGVLAGVYRVVLFISITLFVLGQFFAIGLVLAVWTAAAWFILPAGKFVHWLATSSQLSEHRARTVWISAGIAVLAFVVFGVIPMPDRRQAGGIVESLHRTSVYYGTDGFITRVLKRPGDTVQAGEIIAELENRDLLERKRSTLAQLEETQIQERQALAQNEPGVAMIAEQRVRVFTDNIKELDERLEALTVRAPHAGVIAADDPQRLLGGFVKRGQPVCDVVDVSDLRITAALDQRQSRWLIERARTAGAKVDADVRLLSDVSTVLTGKSLEIVEPAQRVLPSAALGFGGGGAFELSKEDRSGRVAKRPQFTIRLSVENPVLLAKAATPGERAQLRFKLEPTPLLGQWLERLSKEIQGRVKL